MSSKVFYTCEVNSILTNSCYLLSDRKSEPYLICCTKTEYIDSFDVDVEKRIVNPLMLFSVLIQRNCVWAEFRKYNDPLHKENSFTRDKSGPAASLK